MRKLLLSLFMLFLFTGSQSGRAQAPEGKAKAQALLENGVELLKKGSADSAEPMLQQAATLDPENALIWFYVGSCQMTQRHFLPAAESMRKCLSLDDANPALGRKNRREATDALGLAYAFQKDYGRAKEVYIKAIEKDPDYPGFLYNLACVSALGGDRPRALDALKKSIEADAKRSGESMLPDPSTDEDLKGLQGDPVFQAILIMNVGPQPNDRAGAELGRKGARLLATGDPEGAAEAERAALEKEPDEARAWFFLGGALEELKKPAEAAEAYKKAVADSAIPHVLTKPMLRYANVRIGKAALSAGDAKDAADAFKAAIAADQFQPTAHYGLAQACAAQGDKAGAIDALRKAYARAEDIGPLDEPLPDVSKDPSFKAWSGDKDWKEFVAALK